MLVDNDRLVTPAFPQETQQPIGGHRVRHPHDRAQQRRETHRAPLHVLRDHVLGVQDADDRVHGAAVDRKPAVRAGRDRAQHLVEGGVRFDSREPRARDHQLASRPQPEPQRAVQADLFERLEQASVAALGNEQLDLLWGVDVAMAGGRNAHQLQQQHAASVEQVNRAREDADRPLHRSQCEEGGLGRHLQRERLGHELADDHGKGGEEDQHRDRGGRLCRHGVDVAEALEPRCQPRRERRLSIRAEDQARERDANLRGRDVAIELTRILDDREQAAGQRVAVLRHPPQAAATHADRRELSRHVEGREQDQQADDRPCQEHAG